MDDYNVMDTMAIRHENLRRAIEAGSISIKNVAPFTASAVGVTDLITELVNMTKEASKLLREEVKKDFSQDTKGEKG